MDHKYLTSENKILSYLNNLTAEVQSELDPWEDICFSLESEYIGQMIVLSAWKPSTINSLSRWNKFFEEIVDNYNHFLLNLFFGN